MCSRNLRIFWRNQDHTLFRWGLELYQKTKIRIFMCYIARNRLFNMLCSVWHYKFWNNLLLHFLILGQNFPFILGWNANLFGLDDVLGKWKNQGYSRVSQGSWERSCRRGWIIKVDGSGRNPPVLRLISNVVVNAIANFLNV